MGCYLRALRLWKKAEWPGVGERDGVTCECQIQRGRDAQTDRQIDKRTDGWTDRQTNTAPQTNFMTFMFHWICGLAMFHIIFGNPSQAFCFAEVKAAN